MLKSMVIVLFGHILEPKQAAALQNLLSAVGHYLDMVDETSPARRVLRRFDAAKSIIKM